MTLPQGAEKARAVRSMFDAIAPRYDLVNRVMTFRMDVGWRRRTIRELSLSKGSRVLDLACGTGDFCRELTRRGLVPIGVDFSWGMLAAARTDAPLVQGDALCLPVPDRAVDGVTCGFALRNFVELAPFFGELARAVRPGGRIALLEVAEPANPILRTGHRVYFGKVVPVIGRLLSDGAAYRYLPKSVAYLPTPDSMLHMIESSGFHDVQRILLSGGITQLIVGTRFMKAIVHRIDHDIDATAMADYAILWLHDGFALAALGEAASIDVPAEMRESAAARAGDVLSSIECDGDVEAYGAGPLAFAALPFATERAATIVVPEIIYGRDLGGTRWITWIGDGTPPPRDALVARLSAPASLHEHPRTFTVSAARTEQSWRASVASVRDHLRAGHARKAVMARELDIVCDAPVARWPVVDRLRTAYATSFVFAVPCAPQGASTPWLVGATPELLVRRIGDIVRSQPMAGTTRRSPDPQTDARLAALLLASHKDRNEHQITIDTVLETLLPWCSYLDSETEPSIVSVANVHHLATFVEGRLSKPLPSVLELVTALHPTPAVCGHPRDAARALIDEHEQMDRGSYAGAVGWVDRHGQGEWAVALRCAEIAGTRARLFAGGGIVVDSDPDAELEETRVKFETMLGAIVRP